MVFILFHLRKLLSALHPLFPTNKCEKKTQGEDNTINYGGNKPAKLLSVSRLALLYDVDEVVCEDERYALSFDAKLGLEVAQDVAKVYVEELTNKKANM